MIGGALAFIALAAIGGPAFAFLAIAVLIVGGITSLGKAGGVLGFLVSLLILGCIIF